MERTPPRRSPRLQGLATESSQDKDAAVANLAPDIFPEPAPALQQQDQIETTAVTAAAAPERNFNQRTEANSVTTFTNPTNVSPQEETIVQILRSQISALKLQLESVQIKAKESDSQCLVLRKALRHQIPEGSVSVTPFDGHQTNAVSTVGGSSEVPNSGLVISHDSGTAASLYSSFAANTVFTSQGYPVMTPQAATSEVPYTTTSDTTYRTVTSALACSANSTNVAANSMVVPVAHPSSSNVGPRVYQPFCAPLLSTGAPFGLSSSTSPIAEAAMSAAASTSNNISNANTVLAPRKLQDLPEFSGLPEEWPLFHTAFIQSTAVYGYTNLENNQRLQKSLKGEARDTVQSLLIHPDNVNAIVEQLRFRFGRPEQLIRSQLSLIREIAPVSESNLGKLIPFATRVQNLVAFLHSANGQQHLANPMLMEELINKLPMSKRIEWAKFASVIQPYATLVHFCEWLAQTANLICTVQSYDSKDTTKRRIVLYAAEEQREKHATTITCVICQHNHKTADCQRFNKATVADRWTEAKRHRLCFSCLLAGHSTRDCRRRKTCAIDGCKRVHHKLLHDYVQTATTISAASQAFAVQQNNNNRQSVLNCNTNATNNKLLFRILPVTLYGGKKSIDTYALLDEGSSVTLIDSTLVHELGLRGYQRKLNVQWFGGRVAQEPSIVVNLSVSGTGIGKKHYLRNVHSVSNLSLPVQNLSQADLKSFIHMRQLPLEPYSGAVPKLLIGLDHCHLGLPSEVMKISCNGPYAVNTELGWTVFGPTGNALPKIPQCLFVAQTQVNNQDLHDLVADYFTTENFGVKPATPIENADDVRAMKILHATTRRINGRFETGLLWKDDNITMPESYTMAYRRLRGIEKRMQRDSVFADSYKGIISSYVKKNYARKLLPEEVAISRNKTWYLPHFAVVNPNKPAKLRLVFDAAAESHGVSLNAHLLKGPQDLRALPSVLFHFREGEIAVCGDIREMFHQVLVRQEDRCAQRFLWRDGDATKDPDVYEMKVMTFGAACSPCAAQFVKTLNAKEHTNHAARAVESILNYHYVDDFVDSFNSEMEAIEVAQQVREMHQRAGFELRNFVSNSENVVTALCGIDVTVSIFNKESLSTEKVLGMFWQPSDDTFGFKLRFHNVDEAIITGARRPTKRELLGIVMSIFDPLGFLSHFTISAKLLMREIWRRKVCWDERLPDGLNVAWNKWRQLLPSALKIQVPRYYFRNGLPKELQLHVLVDASEDASAAVAYWRCTNSTGKLELAFVCSKTKCAPMKPVTIPRLELQAAVLGTRLLQTIREEHTVKASKCFLWSDSKTVVNWIRNEHRRYKPFVAHRVAEILAATTPSNWRWVPTNENVADEATRSKGGLKFGPTSRWLSGPKFLLCGEADWPKEAITFDRYLKEDEELSPKYTLVIVSQKFVDINRFSSFNRLVRTVAWVLRFVSRIRCRQGNRKEQEYGLTSSELDAAKKLLFRHAQEEAFPLELQSIVDGVPILRSSDLHQLSPYKDEEGVMRVQGRIDAASWLPSSARHPIILPFDHALTRLLVTYHHAALKHQNTEATICEIRRSYWIPRLRQLLRKIITSCFVCRLNKATPAAPLMGPLPVDRLEPFVRPFTYTGLDYFGPVSVTIGRRHEKRWVALFTCLTVRAVHLELAHDLSTDACIIAIRNFINRRGVPVRLRSDNGTNFVGVNEEAKRFAEVFDCEQVQSELASRGVEWRFNCPVNPSEGGVWERMVQCTKRVLRQTLKEVAPREHTLQCFLIEAENVVNSRPLTHLPIAPDQEEPLTPNHFLLGSANTSQTPSISVEPEKTCSLRKQWRIARQLRDHFWKRWILEYLPNLTRRTKWCQITKPVEIGDAVFICDANIPRRQWCRGIVEHVYPGADGVVRKADVRTRHGIVRRAASKLAVLDLESSESIDDSRGEGCCRTPIKCDAV